MAYPQIKVIPGINNIISNSGYPVQVIPTGKPNYGGFIFNPPTAKEQGILVDESIYVSIVSQQSLSALQANADVTEVRTGQTFFFPAGAFVWVNAVTVGHKFIPIIWSASVGDFVPDTVPGMPDHPGGYAVFPVGAPTGLVNVIPSYLYQEYSDDDDLQAFVAAQNQSQQNYLDTLFALNLPIYPNAIIAGQLCDWVLQGLYGYKRPILYALRSFLSGTLNTYGPNYLIPINTLKISRPKDAIIADDDIYKRCVTWHYEKGDGKYFNIRWLKRRVARFIYGVNGSCPHIDQTNQISVTFGPNYECTIRFVMNVRNIIGGAICNMFGPNGTQQNKKTGIIPLNTIKSTYQKLGPLPDMDVFSQAVTSGVLELPFQFNFKIKVG